MGIVNEDDLTATVFHRKDKQFQGTFLVKPITENEINF